MKTLTFDFSQINTKKDFFNEFKLKNELSETFSSNYDALYDVLTGELELPMEIHFQNFTLEKLEKFEDLIATLEDAESELEDQLTFRYFMEKE